LGSGFFADNALFIHPTHEILLDTEFGVPTLFKLLPLIFTITFTIVAIALSEFFPKLLIYFKFSRLGYNIFSFFNQRFYIELFYNKYITDVILKLGGQTTKVLDKGSIELLGPFGLEKGLLFLSNKIASLDTGVITSYALYILIGLIFYILIPYLTINNLLIIVIFGLFSLFSYDAASSANKEDKYITKQAVKPYSFVSTCLDSSLFFKPVCLSVFKRYLPFLIIFIVFTGMKLLPYHLSNQLNILSIYSIYSGLMAVQYKIFILNINDKANTLSLKHGFIIFLLASIISFVVFSVKPFVIPSLYY
jgi:hypothetical protein